MIALNLILEGDGAWPDLGEHVVHHRLLQAKSISLAGLQGGMVSGKPSVTFRLDLEDGRVVLAETSLALLLAAADALKARYGDPR